MNFFFRKKINKLYVIFLAYCTRAKRLLQELGQEFFVIELDKEGKRRSCYKLSMIGGGYTVPKPWICAIGEKKRGGEDHQTKEDTV